MVCDHDMHSPAYNRLTSNHYAYSLNRVVRDAMISVMLATTPSCKSLVSWRLPPEGAEEETDVGDSNCQVEGRWSKAVTAGGAVLPRTTSTCLMWCAIALGALVRGIPLTHVGGLPSECEWFYAVKRFFTHYGFDCTRSRGPACFFLNPSVFGMPEPV